MNFLVDAQLPPNLCKVLQRFNCESIHVNELPNGDETSDTEIAKFAKQNDYILISKDTDFYHSYMINRLPPRLLLLTIGNIRNKTLYNLIEQEFDSVKKLFETCDYVELSYQGLIGHKF